ncbi:MAG: PEP-utilizing enzyme [Thermomicrobiales bacterium]
MSGTETQTHAAHKQAAGAPAAGPLPTPPDFPVTWEQPGDEQIFWTMDRMHFPTQVAPLADSFLRTVFERSFNQGVGVYGAPIRAMARRFNTYHYEHMGPPPLPPEELAAMGERAQPRISAVMGRLLATWQQDWLPAIQQELNALAAFDLQGADQSAFIAHFAETMRRHERLWAIHFEMAAPFLLSMSLFQDVHRDLLGGDDAFDAFRLLQGFDNETLRANRALWRLSQSVTASPELRRLVLETPAADVPAALASAAGGPAFLVKLDAYLDEFGKRGSNFADVDQPSWRENPTPAIEALKGYIVGDGADPEEERAALAASREELLARTRERLRGYPEQAVGQFEFLLKAAQEAVVLSEDHGWYIDWRGLYEVRQVLLEAGRRLAAAGTLAARDDVFFLSFEEAQEALAAPGDQWQAIIVARQAEWDHFGAIAPPPVVGTLPSGPPPDDPMVRALGKFFGGPPPQAETRGVIRGNAGSPGHVTGRAVVARSLADAGRLRPGDILVAETTAPPWTPLFISAAAVVTDTGGILCHSAVVAREYRIPAVVGTGMATAIIPDGATIEVDGNAGTVRIVA